MSKKFTVQLAADQFDRLARPTQLATAVAELIWNGLDAESERVEVVIERSIADAVEALTWANGRSAGLINCGAEGARTPDPRTASLVRTVPLTCDSTIAPRQTLCNCYR